MLHSIAFVIDVFGTMSLFLGHLANEPADEVMRLCIKIGIKKAAANSCFPSGAGRVLHLSAAVDVSDRKPSKKSNCSAHTHSSLFGSLFSLSTVRVHFHDIDLVIIWIGYLAKAQL